MVSFTFSLVDKVTMGTYNFVFAVLNVISFLLSSASLYTLLPYITQSIVQFFWRWFLQTIKGISNDRQKLLRCFNGTNIFTFFKTPSAAVLDYV